MFVEHKPFDSPGFEECPEQVSILRHCECSNGCHDDISARRFMSGTRAAEKTSDASGIPTTHSRSHQSTPMKACQSEKGGDEKSDEQDWGGPIQIQIPPTGAGADNRQTIENQSPGIMRHAQNASPRRASRNRLYPAKTSGGSPVHTCPPPSQAPVSPSAPPNPLIACAILT